MEDQNKNKFKNRLKMRNFELISYPIPMESIDVIEELLLKGEYDFTLDGEKLIMSLHN